MPPPHRAGFRAAALLAFHRGTGRTDAGYTLEQMLAWDDGDREHQHDFVQWVFPTDRPSTYNPGGPVLDAQAVARFRAAPPLRAGVRRGFDQWLGFCGMARTPDGLAFDRPNSGVWGRPNHNWLRVTRVLRSLRLVGLDKEAESFSTLLADIREGGRPKDVAALGGGGPTGPVILRWVGPAAAPDNRGHAAGYANPGRLTVSGFVPDGTAAMADEHRRRAARMAAWARRLHECTADRTTGTAGTPSWWRLGAGRPSAGRSG